MSWFKEVAKTCLNLAVLVLGVFVFGFVANPNWKWWYLLAGLFLAAWFVWLSWLLWKKGGE
jgi:heme O synthase-like polyprenyltransferase